MFGCLLPICLSLIRVIFLNSLSLLTEISAIQSVHIACLSPVSDLMWPAVMNSHNTVKGYISGFLISTEVYFVSSHQLVVKVIIENLSTTFSAGQAFFVCEAHVLHRLAQHIVCFRPLICFKTVLITTITEASVFGRQGNRRW